MNITQYQGHEANGEWHDEYGVVADDGKNALRVRVIEKSGRTILSAHAGYRGEQLAFEGEDVVGSTPSDYLPLDDDGRQLRVDIEPPLRDDTAREHAATVFAGAVFDSSRAGELFGLPGNSIVISLHAMS